MPFVEIEHGPLDLPEGGENEARRFYGTMLGMTEVPKPAPLSQCGVWFRAGRVELHLDGRLDGRSATAWNSSSYCSRRQAEADGARGVAYSSRQEHFFGV